MSEMGVFDVLRKVFIYVGYPAVIIAAFLVIAVRMKALFQDYHSDRLMQWRLAVAGLLPVAILTFVVVGKFPEGVSWVPTADQWEMQLPLGALIAVATLEASQHVSGTRQALSFMLYLSALGTGVCTSCSGSRNGRMTNRCEPSRKSLTISLLCNLQAPGTPEMDWQGSGG